MPILGVIIYFIISPRFTPAPIVYSHIFGLIIVTVLAPIVLSFFLKNLGVTETLYLENVEERRIPIILHIGLFILTIKTLINLIDFPELYYFFSGMLFSLIGALAFVIFKYKVSLHMIGIGAITAFTIGLSVHFSTNQIMLIGGLFILAGFIATSRLFTQEHTPTQLLLGVLVGIAPQITLYRLWL